MVQENEFLKAALERLKKETKEVTGSKEKAMAAAVGAALADFCTQEPEFAQAIVQGGPFKDCMAAVARGVGTSISDSEAFAKAARFYFPGCRVRVMMQIDLIGDAGDDPYTAARSPSPASRGGLDGGQPAADSTNSTASTWTWKKCLDCGAAFCGGPLARYCLDCRKAHVARSSKARRLCDIGARARWGEPAAKEEGRGKK